MVFTPKRCSNPHIGLVLIRLQRHFERDIILRWYLAHSFLFTNASCFNPHLKVNRLLKPQNKNTAPPLIGKLPWRIAQAIRPKTERLNTMSAQRCLFCILLYSRIHFKKSIVRKVCISTFISFLLSMLSSFLLSWPVNNIVFAKFHALKTHKYKKSNQIVLKIK